MAFYYCLLFDVDGTLLDFNAAEDGALRDTLAHFSLPNTEDAVSQYHDINNALWAALEQGKVRQDKLVIQRFEKLLAAFGVQGNPVEINDYYLTQLSQRADTFPGAEEALEELEAPWEQAVRDRARARAIAAARIFFMIWSS